MRSRCRAHLARLCASAPDGPRLRHVIGEGIARACRGLGDGEVVKLPIVVERGEVALEVHAANRREPVRLWPVAALRPTDRGPEVKRVNRGWADAALARARGAGAGDALIVGRDGRLGEASNANVFVVRDDGSVVTPPRGGIVAGVVRNWVLEACGAAEAIVSLDDLSRCREVFLSTAGRSIVLMRSVGDPRFDDHTRAERLHHRWARLPRTLPA